MRLTSVGIKPTTSGLDLPLVTFGKVGLSWVSNSTLIYTSELTLCSTICVRSATYAAQHSYVPLLSLRRDSPPNRPWLSLSDLVAQSAE